MAETVYGFDESKSKVEVPDKATYDADISALESGKVDKTTQSAKDSEQDTSIATAQSTAEGKQDPIVAGTGISIGSDGKTINHSNSVSAQTSYIGSATAVPRLKFDEQGHITGVTTATIYPPTTAGTSGYIWVSNGSGAGTWKDPSTMFATKEELEEISFLPPGYRTEITFDVWTPTYDEFMAQTSTTSTETMSSYDCSPSRSLTPISNKIVLGETDANPKNITINGSYMKNGDTSSEYKIYATGNYDVRGKPYYPAQILRYLINNYTTVKTNYYGTFDATIGLYVSYSMKCYGGVTGYHCGNYSIKGTLSITASGATFAYSSSNKNYMIAYEYPVNSWNYPDNIYVGVSSISLSLQA